MNKKQINLVLITFTVAAMKFGFNVPSFAALSTQHIFGSLYIYIHIYIYIYIYIYISYTMKKLKRLASNIYLKGARICIESFKINFGK